MAKDLGEALLMVIEPARCGVVDTANVDKDVRPLPDLGVAGADDLSGLRRWGWVGRAYAWQLAAESTVSSYLELGAYHLEHGHA